MKTTSEDLQYLTLHFLQSLPLRRSGAAVTSGHRGESLEATRHVDWFPTKVKKVISGEKTVLPTNGALQEGWTQTRAGSHPEACTSPPRV